MAVPELFRIPRLSRRAGGAASAILVLVLCAALQAPVLAWAQGQPKPRSAAPDPVEQPATATAYRESFALLIGVDKYPKLPPGNDLHYAARDVEELRDVLVQKYG